MKALALRKKPFFPSLRAASLRGHSWFRDSLSMKVRSSPNLSFLDTRYSDPFAIFQMSSLTDLDENLMITGRGLCIPPSDPVGVIDVKLQVGSEVWSDDSAHFHHGVWASLLPVPQRIQPQLPSPLVPLHLMLQLCETLRVLYVWASHRNHVGSLLLKLFM